MEASAPPDRRIQLIVGLGNPGPQYAGTWHNLGGELLDYWAQTEGLRWESQKRFTAAVARREGVWLMKPQGFMNLSGHSVAPFCHFYRLAPASVLVIYDDVRLLAFQSEICSPKSAGGHNGVRSLLAALGPDLVHFRIGIGPKPPSPALADFVLSPIPDSLHPLYQEKLPEFVKKLKDIVDKGLIFGMNGRRVS